MDSELLLKFIGYFPDYLSALSRTLLRFFFFWTTFVETAVYLHPENGTHYREYPSGGGGGIGRTFACNYFTD